MVAIAPPGEVIAVIVLLGFAAVPMACLALIVWLIRKSPESFFFRKRERSLYSKLINTEAREILSCPYFFKNLKSPINEVVPDECLNCTKLVECVKYKERERGNVEKGT
ncbi:MAG: hypothetical protein ACE5OW_04725 [Candidatus Bathyarchaeia archaeon]